MIHGTPDSEQPAVVRVCQSEENAALDDLITDLEKHQTPTKSQKRTTPSKSQVLFIKCGIGLTTNISRSTREFIAKISPSHLSKIH